MTSRIWILMMVLAVSGIVSAQMIRRTGSGLLNNRRAGPAAMQQQAPADENSRPPLATRDDLRNVPKGTNGVPALAFNQTPLELVLEAYARLAESHDHPAFARRPGPDEGRLSLCH